MERVICSSQNNTSVPRAQEKELIYGRPLATTRLQFVIKSRLGCLYESEQDSEPIDLSFLYGNGPCMLGLTVWKSNYRHEVNWGRAHTVLPIFLHPETTLLPGSSFPFISYCYNSRVGTCSWCYCVTSLSLQSLNSCFLRTHVLCGRGVPAV